MSQMEALITGAYKVVVERVRHGEHAGKFVIDGTPLTLREVVRLWHRRFKGEKRQKAEQLVDFIHNLFEQTDWTSVISYDVRRRPRIAPTRVEFVYPCPLCGTKHGHGVPFDEERGLSQHRGAHHHPQISFYGATVDLTDIESSYYISLTWKREEFRKSGHARGAA
jgi:hypothetical protein